MAVSWGYSEWAQSSRTRHRAVPQPLPLLRERSLSLEAIFGRSPTGHVFVGSLGSSGWPLELKQEASSPAWGMGSWLCLPSPQAGCLRVLAPLKRDRSLWVGVMAGLMPMLSTQDRGRKQILWAPTMCLAAWTQCPIAFLGNRSL